MANSATTGGAAACSMSMDYVGASLMLGWEPLRRVMGAASRAPYGPGLVVVSLVVLLGGLFVASYSLALGRPRPHRIPTGLVAATAADRGLIGRLERAAGSTLVLRDYPSAGVARRAIVEQHAYAAIIFEPRPSMLVASASGSSVAQVLEQAARMTGRPIRVVDIVPLPAGDPSGLVLFYATLAATILGFVAMFQLRANAHGLSLRAWLAFVVGLAVLAGLTLTFVSGPVIGALRGSLVEKSGILALEALSASLFNSTMLALVGRWAIIPTWLLFIVLGNTSSGGAVSPPLLPPFYSFIGRWLPPGATVSALRNAVYFPDAQHAEPLVVLAAWSLAGLASLILADKLLHRIPSQP